MGYTDKDILNLQKNNYITLPITIILNSVIYDSRVGEIWWGVLFHECNTHHLTQSLLMDFLWKSLQLIKYQISDHPCTTRKWCADLWKLRLYHRPKWLDFGDQTDHMCLVAVTQNLFKASTHIFWQSHLLFLKLHFRGEL